MSLLQFKQHHRPLPLHTFLSQSSHQVAEAKNHNPREQRLTKKCHKRANLGLHKSKLKHLRLQSSHSNRRRRHRQPPIRTLSVYLLQRRWQMLSKKVALRIIQDSRRQARDLSSLVSSKRRRPKTQHNRKSNKQQGQLLSSNQHHKQRRQKRRLLQTLQTPPLPLR